MIVVLLQVGNLTTHNFMRVIFLLLILTYLDTSGQINISSNFQKAQTENKKFIILRYDGSTVKFSKEKNYTTSDFKIDSLVSTEEFEAKIKKDYILYRFDIHTENEIDKQFIKKFKYDYTPNLCVFSSDGKIEAYLQKGLYNGKDDIVQELKDSIINSATKIQRMTLLENLASSNKITSNEIFELISIRSSLMLKSTEYFNLFAQKQGTLNEEIVDLASNQDLDTNDPFSEYFFKSNIENENWKFLKVQFIDNIIETATMNSNSNEFEKASKLKEEYQKLAFANGLDFGITPIDSASLESLISEQQISQKFEFYRDKDDLTKLIEVGNKYAIELIEDYEVKKKKHLERELSSLEYITNLTNSSTDKKIGTNDLEQNRKIVLEREAKSYDSFTANELNSIAWVFYEKIKDKNELKKALFWSEFSIKLAKTPEKLDTYAHVLFTIGDIKKAIIVEESALELVKKDSQYKRFINEFENELVRFKKANN